MEQIWFTIEDTKGNVYNAKEDWFYGDEDMATEYDEYNDAALIAESVLLENGVRRGACSVIRHFKKNGIVNRSVAGDF